MAALPGILLDEYPTIEISRSPNRRRTKTDRRVGLFRQLRWPFGPPFQDIRAALVFNADVVWVDALASGVVACLDIRTRR